VGGRGARTAFAPMYKPYQEDKYTERYATDADTKTYTKTLVGVDARVVISS